jgi:hypothetical protein
MIAHPKGPQTHCADAQECPPLRVEASFESTFFEDRQHVLPLRPAQAGGTAGNGARVQAGHVALMLAALLSPCADGHPTYAQAAGNVGMGELSSLQQPASFQASFFTWTTGEGSWTPDHGHRL